MGIRLSRDQLTKESYTEVPPMVKETESQSFPNTFYRDLGVAISGITYYID
jgi:hypothetical protein